MTKIKIIRYTLVFLLGSAIGAIFPLLFTYMDLKELGMDITYQNIQWIIHSQDLITFSYISLPIVFGFILVLYMQNIEKNKELKSASTKMANMAHAAGMGEIAAEVIHNIGNVLTSVFASVEKSLTIIDESQYNTAGEAEKMVEEKRELFKKLAEEDKKFEQLIDYYVYYTKTTVEEMESINEELNGLKKKLNIIRDILMTQKSYAYSKAYYEKTTGRKMVDASIKIFQEKLIKCGIDLNLEIDDDVIINTQTSKVVNILSNLIKNAIEAMEDGTADKCITITTKNLNEWVQFSVRDSGPGISDECKKKVFTYGFTTKQKGAGLGLHSCYNLAKSLEGKFEVSDPDSGPGAVFNLYLPR